MTTVGGVGRLARVTAPRQQGKLHAEPEQPVQVLPSTPSDPKAPTPLLVRLTAGSSVAQMVDPIASRDAHRRYTQAVLDTVVAALVVERTIARFRIGTVSEPTVHAARLDLDQCRVAEKIARRSLLSCRPDVSNRGPAGDGQGSPWESD